MLAILTLAASAHLETSASTGGFTLFQTEYSRTFDGGLQVGAMASLRTRSASWLELGLGGGGYYITSEHGGSTIRLEAQTRFRTTADNAFFAEIALGVLNVDYVITAYTNTFVYPHIAATMPYFRLGLGGIVKLGTVGLVLQLSALASTGAKARSSEARVSAGDVEGAIGAFLDVGVRFDL